MGNYKGWTQREDRCRPSGSTQEVTKCPEVSCKNSTMLLFRTGDPFSNFAKEWEEYFLRLNKDHFGGLSFLQATL